jgi:hypothetical protein
MIPKFNAGGIIRASDLNLLADEIRKNEITKVVGGTFSRTSGGTTITLPNQNNGGGGGGGGLGLEDEDGDFVLDGNLKITGNVVVEKLVNQTQFYGPFQVLPGWSTGGYYTCRVNGNSFLTNIETGEGITIEGLGAASGSLSDISTDPGQFILPNVGDYIWLTVSIYKNEILAAYIEHGTPGQVSAWPNFPKPVEFEEETEATPFKEAKYTRIAIAQIHLKSEGNISGMEFNFDLINLPPGTPRPPEDPTQIYVVRQLVTTHLGLQLAVVESTVVPILVPYSGTPVFAVALG